jgi:hypothetical protein
LKLAATGSAGELKLVRDLLAAPALPIDRKTLEGNWRCRAFHLGGMAPLTVNPFFACRFARERGAILLQKLTGSLRRNAYLHTLDDKRVLMYGAYWAAGENQPSYGADDYRDEVGILERIGPNRLRLELPEPRAFNTARHEVIELVRGR